MGTAITASLAATALWIFAYLVVAHIYPEKSPMPAMAGAWLTSLPVLLLLLAVLNHNEGIVIALNGQENALLSWFYALLLYLLLFFLFVECYYHIKRSVTLRLLFEIQTSANPEPIIGEIMKNYSVDDMIKRRLDDLERTGFVRKTGDRWVLSSKGVALAKILGFSCWIFRSKPQNERL